MVPVGSTDKTPVSFLSTHGENSMGFIAEAQRLERGSGWESRYFWLGLSLTAAETVTGLYLLCIDDLTHLDMSLLLFHILAGFPFVLPCIMFWRRHARYAPLVGRSGFAWLGWSCVLAMVFTLISGVWLTFRGITGIYWLWLTHTIVSLYGAAALILYVALTVKIWLGELPVDSKARVFFVGLLRRISWKTAIGTAVFLLACGGFALAYQEPEPDREVADYAYSLSDDPFYPSRVQTESGGFYEPVTFLRSETCGLSSCHVETLRQFQDSVHFRSPPAVFGVVEQVFMAEAAQGSFLGDRNILQIDALREIDGGKESFRFCAGCHTPVAMIAGEIGPGQGLPDFETWEGDSCVLCHRITSVGGKNGGGGGDYEVAPPPNRYLFAFSDHPALQWLYKVQINNKPEHHQATFDQPFYDESRYCVGCHQRLQFSYWELSPYNDEHTEDNETCQTCHMPQVETHDDVSALAKGTISDHRTLAANLVTPLIYGLDEQARLTREFMQDDKMVVEVVAPTLTHGSEEGGTLDFVVRVINKGVGHIFPAGPESDLVEAWPQVSVTTSDGQVLLEYGELDENGHLDHESTYVYHVTPFNSDGDVLELDRHRNWMISEDRLHVVPARYYDEFPFSVELPPGLTEAELTIDAGLPFRKFNQAFLDFAAEGGFCDRLVAPVVDLDRVEARVQVTSDDATVTAATESWLQELRSPADLEGYTKKPRFDDYLLSRKLSLEDRILIAQAKDLYRDLRYDEALAILDSLAEQDLGARPGLASLREALVQSRAEAQERAAPYTVDPFAPTGG